MTAPNYSHGKDGCVTVGSTELRTSSWDLDYGNETKEVTTCQSGGWREYIAGLSGGSGTFKAFWDLNANPTASPPGLLPGSIVTLKLYVSATSYFRCDAIIESLKVTVDVNDVINWTASFKATGAITLPV